MYRYLYRLLSQKCTGVLISPKQSSCIDLTLSLKPKQGVDAHLWTGRVGRRTRQLWHSMGKSVKPVEPCCWHRSCTLLQTWSVCWGLLAGPFSTKCQSFCMRVSALEVRLAINLTCITYYHHKWFKYMFGWGIFAKFLCDISTFSTFYPGF